MSAAAFVRSVKVLWLLLLLSAVVGSQDCHTGVGPNKAERLLVIGRVVLLAQLRNGLFHAAAAVQYKCMGKMGCNVTLCARMVSCGSGSTSVGSKGRKIFGRFGRNSTGAGRRLVVVPPVVVRTPVNDDDADDDLECRPWAAWRRFKVVAAGRTLVVFVAASGGGCCFGSAATTRLL